MGKLLLVRLFAVVVVVLRAALLLPFVISVDAVTGRLALGRRGEAGGAPQRRREPDPGEAWRRAARRESRSAAGAGAVGVPVLVSGPWDDLSLSYRPGLAGALQRAAQKPQNALRVLGSKTGAGSIKNLLGK